MSGQLLASQAHAGHVSLTQMVGNIRGEHERLADLGLAPGGIEAADHATILRLRDPDGNLVVLAPSSATPST